MTKLSTAFLQSGATLAVGAAVITAPMFAFAHSQNDNSGQDTGATRTIAISDNGSALVRGAKVASVANGVITATTVWNNLSVTWTIDTDSNTDLVRLNGANASLSNVSVGDYVSVSGMLDTAQSGFTIKADTVRDWSLTDPTDTKDHDSTGFWQQMKTHIPVFNFFSHGDEHKNDR